MSNKGKYNKGEKSRRTSEGLNFENVDNRSRGLSIEEEKSPSKKGGSGTPVSRAYFDTISVPKQDRTLFDELENTHRDYRDAIEKGSLVAPEVFGLPLTLRGQLVFRELLETAIIPNLKLLHSLPKVEKSRLKDPSRNLEDKYGIRLGGTINLVDLAKRATGGDRGSDIENTKNALFEFLEKEITITEADGTIRVIKPVSLNEKIYTKGKKGDPVKIVYTLHPIFTVSINPQFFILPPSYIVRGQRFPNWGYNLVNLLWYSAQLDLTDNIYHSKKAVLFDRVINLPEDIKKYKKNPQRKKQDFEKILSRLREVNLIIPGTHKNEKGETVSDNGYYETTHRDDGSIISNFRLNGDLSEILRTDENERLKLL